MTRSRPRRLLQAVAVALAACGVSALVLARGGTAIDSTDQTAYGVVDPNADGPGNPGFVTEHNMASVRRVATGHYCLRASIHFDQPPSVSLTVDGTQPHGRFAIAVSDLRARYCDHNAQEIAVVTYLIAGGVARPSNSIRFAPDPVG